MRPVGEMMFFMREGAVEVDLDNITKAVQYGAVRQPPARAAN